MNPITSPISFAIAGKWSAVVATTVLSLGLLGGVRPPVAQPAANAERVIPQERTQPAMTEFAAEVPAAVEAEPELLHASTPEVETPPPLPVPSDAVPLPRPTHTIWVQVTAYCSCKKCCGPLARGITASGRSVQYNGGLFDPEDGTAATTTGFPQLSTQLYFTAVEPLLSANARTALDRAGSQLEWNTFLLASPDFNYR